MKNQLKVFLVFLSFQLFAQNPLGIFKNPINLFSEASIAQLLKHRCVKYIPEARQGNACGIYALEFIEKLDLKVITHRKKTKKGFKIVPRVVVFKEELLGLMGKNKTTHLLSEINQKMNSKEKFNVFSYLKKALASEDKALQFMAVMFQDIVPYSEKNNKGYQRFVNENALFTYLDPSKRIFVSKVYKRNFNLLKEISLKFAISHFQKPLKRKGKIETKVTVYPEGINISENSYGVFYHFYVTAYMARKLLAGGYINPYGLAHHMPFLFNYIYEVAMMSKLSKIPFNLKELLLDEPDKITGMYKLSDIYLGYRGSRFGAGFPAKILSTTDFNTYFVDGVYLAPVCK